MSDLFLSALPFFYFMFIAAITPGPNNVMLTASGMNFGFYRTMPHMLGIIIGYLALLVCCAFGVGAAYQAYPPVQIILKVLGSAYLVYLAYRIFNAGRLGVHEKAEETSRPLTFLEAFGFQFINPKGVVFGLAAMAILPAGYSMAEHLLMIVIIAPFCSIVSTNLWVFFGKIVARLFRDDKTRRVINAVLALLLLATLPMMVL